MCSSSDMPIFLSFLSAVPTCVRLFVSHFCNPDLTGPSAD